MANYHFSVQVISRSDGRSAIGAAAYRAATRLYSEYQQKWRDYSRKRGVEHSEILLPKNAPEWFADRSNLWNHVEKIEKRCDSQLAREVEMSLPVELSKEAQLALARRFIHEEFVDKGMVADFSIHREDEGNPHVHVMLTMRDLREDGTFGLKRRDWNRVGNLLEWREAWANAANEALAREGHSARIDHRSYAMRGIDLDPQPKLFRRQDEVSVDGRDHVHDRYAELLTTARENGERLLQNPETALRALTSNRSTFTAAELHRFINTHTETAQQFSDVLLKVHASPELVELPREGAGPARYTTESMLKLERALEDTAEDLHRHRAQEVGRELVRQAIETGRLNAEQATAVEYLTRESGSLAIVQGYAGTGKSFMLRAAREAWEAQGLVVVGAALAGKAAEGLERESGIQSYTLARWEYAWSVGAVKLESDMVLVVDEAAMVGTAQLENVLRHAREAGAKVVLVGDTGQLQAISAGAPMRLLHERYGAATLKDIQRQSVGWQRDASKLLAGTKPEEGLALYEREGRVHQHATQAEARAAMVRAWAAHRAAAPKESSLLLAYRHVDVRALNELARESQRVAGLLGRDHMIQTAAGERAFATGDRLYFLRSDRSMGVHNGSLGTIEAIRGTTMVIRLDGSNRQVVVDTSTYQNLDHGYAATIHKGQGATVDRAFVLADALFDRTVTYPAMTRHRADVELHWSKEMFPSQQTLMKVLSREQPRPMAIELAEDLGKASAKLPAADESFLALSEAEQNQVLHQLREQASVQGLRPQEALRHVVTVQASADRVKKAEEAWQIKVARLNEFERADGWRLKLMGSAHRELVLARDKAEEEYLRAKHGHDALLKDPEMFRQAGVLASKHNTARGKARERLNRLTEARTNARRVAFIEQLIAESNRRGRAIYRGLTDEDQKSALVFQELREVRGVKVAVFTDEQGKRVVVDSLRLGSEVQKAIRGQRVQLGAPVAARARPPRTPERSR